MRAERGVLKDFFLVFLLVIFDLTLLLLLFIVALLSL